MILDLWATEGVAGEGETISDSLTGGKTEAKRQRGAVEAASAEAERLSSRDTALLRGAWRSLQGRFEAALPALRQLSATSQGPLAVH